MVKFRKMSEGLQSCLLSIFQKIKNHPRFFWGGRGVGEFYLNEYYLWKCRGGSRHFHNLRGGLFFFKKQIGFQNNLYFKKIKRYRGFIIQSENLPMIWILLKVKYSHSVSTPFFPNIFPILHPTPPFFFIISTFNIAIIKTDFLDQRIFNKQ